MTARDDEDLLDAADFAKYLGISARQLRDRVRARKVPRPVRYAGGPRWKWRVIRQWTEAVEFFRLHNLELEEEPAVETEEEISGSLRQVPAVCDGGGSNPKKPR